MQFNRFLLPALAVCSITILSGCSAKGQPFTEFSKPKENQGLVYVYRPSSFIGGAVYYDVHLQTLKLQTLWLANLQMAAILR